MKDIKFILMLIFSIVQTSYGQIEKLITTINYSVNSSDTTLTKIEYDSNGKRIKDNSRYISHPLRIDTIQVSDKEQLIEYIWEGNSKSVMKETNTSTEIVKIGYSRNGTDTTFFSSFKLSKKGLPVEGIIINHADTSKYVINKNFSLIEIRELQSNILSNSEFIEFQGIIQFQNRRYIKITDLNEQKDIIKIRLNKKLKPRKVIKRQWHDYHQMTFKNKYLYKYKANKLVKLKNVDNHGDIEMIRTIQYKLK